MLKFTRNDGVEPYEFIDNLTTSGFIYVRKDLIERRLKFNKAKLGTAYTLTQEIMRVNSQDRFALVEPEYVYQYLVNYENCPEHKFKADTGVGYSLAMGKILEPLYKDGYAQEFLSCYMLYKSLKSKNGKMNKLLPNLVGVEGEVDHEDEQVYRLKFNVNSSKNARFYYSDTDIIGISKDYSNAITTTKGRVLVQGDIKQADFRIFLSLFIIDEENRSSFENADDMYEALAKEVYKFHDRPFSKEKFKEERDMYKVFALATSYGRRAGDTEESKVFVKEFREYLLTRPRYVELQKRIDDRCKLGIPILVNSYFKHQELIPLQPEEDFRKTKNDATNSPIQSGTSDIVMLIGQSVLDSFYKLGYTKKDVRIYYTRHDELIFDIDEKVMKDSWVFKDCSKLIVDNWVPMELDFSFGYVYGEDEDLQEMYLQSIEDNKEKIKSYSPNWDLPYDFYPIGKTKFLSYGFSKIGDAFLGILYDKSENKIDPIKINTTDEVEAKEHISDRLYQVCRNLAKQGYKSVGIYTDIAFDDAEYEGVYVKRLVSNVETSEVNYLTEYKAYQYCSKRGIENTSQYSFQDADRFNGMERLGLFD